MAERIKKMKAQTDVLVKEISRPEGLLVVKLKRLITRPPEQLVSQDMQDNFEELLSRILDAKRTDVVKRIFGHISKNFENDDSELRAETSKTLTSGLAKLLKEGQADAFEGSLGLLTNALAKEKTDEVRVVIAESLAELVGQTIEAQVYSSLPSLFEQLIDLEKTVSKDAPQVKEVLRKADEQISSNPELIQEMLNIYGSQDEAKSQTAEKVLLSVENPSILSKMLDILRDTEDRKLRRKCLVLIGKRAKTAQQEIVSRLTTPGNEWYVNRNLILLLGDAEDDEASITIKPFLKDPEPRVRKACVQALAKLGGEQSFETLSEGLYDTDPTIRRNVVAHLRTSKSRKAVDRLTRILEDKNTIYSSINEDLVVDVCHVLGKIGGDDAVPALAGCVKPDGFFARKKKSDTIMTAAAKALGDIKSPAATEILQKYKKHSRPTVSKEIKSILDI